MDRSLWKRGCSSNAADLTIAAKEAKNNLLVRHHFQQAKQYLVFMSLPEDCTSQLHQLCEMS